MPAPLYYTPFLIFNLRMAPLTLIRPQILAGYHFIRAFRFKGATQHLVAFLGLSFLPLLRLGGVELHPYAQSFSFFICTEDYFTCVAQPGDHTLPPAPIFFDGAQSFLWVPTPPHLPLSQRLGLESRSTQPLWGTFFAVFSSVPTTGSAYILTGMAPFVALALAYNPQASQHKLWVR